MVTILFFQGQLQLGYSTTGNEGSKRWIVVRHEYGILLGRFQGGVNIVHSFLDNLVLDKPHEAGQEGEEIDGLFVIDFAGFTFVP